MIMVCLDVEGVLLPEIWQVLAARTGIAALGRTTRDEPDFAALMAARIAALARAGLGYDDVLDVVADVEPLPGAVAFLGRLRQTHQVSLISDSFYQFLMPLFARLGAPSIFCHDLVRGKRGEVRGWRPRLDDQKPKCVEEFRTLGFHVIAAGDSFNDLGMLDAADDAAFVNAPSQVTALRPGLTSSHDLDELAQFIDRVHEPAMTAGSLRYNF